jgi:5'-3' exonuclease
LYRKLFAEDENKISKQKRTERQTLLAKLKSKLPADKEAPEDPEALINAVEDDCLSDLRPEEIGDDNVSEPEVQLESLDDPVGKNDDGAADVQADMDNEIEQQNLKFMTDFVKIYAEDSNKAKEFYYKTKVHMDITTESGQQQRRKMLKKYLEGMQWVLYYYYRGSSHWRWYYPYHYAPMISDLGINIVAEFLGTTTITSFEVDFNCPANKMPYTPFQQLLCIMPLKSFKLLPHEYLEIPNRMAEDYPSNFAVDLNGKTNAWEAIVLIPFVDETKVIEEEAQLVKRGLQLSEKDKKRNSIAF